ncbi:MAG: hypothetical protein DYG89_03835 [Caldilinea sp. CFX5]|nr:hypothetical protein [Caldilinea sp. CFX5]
MSQYWPLLITALIVLCIIYALWRSSQMMNKSSLPSAVNTQTSVPANQSNLLTTKLTRQQRKAITQQAMAGYKTTRGYAHRLLLAEAIQKVATRLTQAQKEYAEAEAVLPRLERQQQAELQAALEWHLLQTKMSDISGIGEALQQRILSQTQARRLTDLERASTVNGVGEARMNSIRGWIKHYQAQLPRLMTTSFPGRAAINKKFTTQIESARVNLQAKAQMVERLKQQRAQIEEKLAPLQPITQEHFIRAAFGAESDQLVVEQFQRGLFAEWEPMPTWFKTLLKEDQ